MVGAVESLNARITVFAARRVAATIWVNGQTVDGPEMTFDASELFLVHQMEESRIEFTGTGGRCGDLHGILATAQDDVIENRTDRSRIDRTLGFVCLQAHQAVAVEQFGRGVLRGGHKHGAIFGHLHVVDVGGVILHRIQFLGHAQIVQRNGAVLVARNDVVVQLRPQRRCDFRLWNGNAKNWFGIGRRRVHATHIDDDQITNLSHGRVGGIGSLIPRITEIRCTHRRFAFDGGRTFASFTVPQSANGDRKKRL